MCINTVSMSTDGGALTTLGAVFWSLLSTVMLWMTWMKFKPAVQDRTVIKIVKNLMFVLHIVGFLSVWINVALVGHLTSTNRFDKVLNCDPDSTMCRSTVMMLAQWASFIVEVCRGAAMIFADSSFSVIPATTAAIAALTVHVALMGAVQSMWLAANFLAALCMFMAIIPLVGIVLFYQASIRFTGVQITPMNPLYVNPERVQLDSTNSTPTSPIVVTIDTVSVKAVTSKKAPNITN